MTNKYHARKMTVGGITFDSRKEADRWQTLRLLERAGKISELQRQVKYPLLPAQKVDGKTAERAVSYIADFVYLDAATGKIVVEDVKGVKTEVYKLKRKLMLFFHGVQVKEV